jgi:hypothetical protein
MKSSDEDKTTYKLSRKVFAVRDNNFSACEDMRTNPLHINGDANPCPTHAKDAGFLYEIKDMKRSHLPGIFAEASVIYIASDDLEKACKVTCYLDAPQKEGTAYFTLNGKTINVMMPEGLNLQSAFKP